MPIPYIAPQSMPWKLDISTFARLYPWKWLGGICGAIPAAPGPPGAAPGAPPDAFAEFAAAAAAAE